MERQIRDITEFRLEKDEKDLKGIKTEDSALKIISDVCHKNKIYFLPRVLPPLSSDIGECDAIIFSDSGIIIAEIKRYGGNILDLNTKSDTIRIEKGEETVSQYNPIPKLLEKCQKLEDYIKNIQFWSEINKSFYFAKISETVPVYPLLCFGPSTDYDETKVASEMPDLIIANTKTLRKRLTDFLEQKRKIIGISRAMYIHSINWKSIGKIKIVGKSGFLRGYPRYTKGNEPISLIDSKLIKMNKKGKVEVVYKDNIKKSSSRIDAIIFRISSEHQWNDAVVHTGTEIIWEAGGE